MPDVPEFDPHLDRLQAFANGVDFSFETPVTLIVGGARIEGRLAPSIAAARHVDDTLRQAFEESSDTEDDARANLRAALAKAFAGQPVTEIAEARRSRRTQLLQQLEEAGDGPARDLLQEEFERLDHLGPAISLLDARVWAPGFNPVDGPIRVPLIRVNAARVDAWWIGTRT